MELLDLVIDKAVERFSYILNVDLIWSYFKIDESNLEDLIYMAYDKETKLIFVNPNIVGILRRNNLSKEEMILTIYSKIAHEAYHRLQDINGYLDSDGYDELGEEYILNRTEIEAYAFEEAIIKIICNDITLKLDIKNIDEIHEKSMKFYFEYKGLFEKTFE